MAEARSTFDTESLTTLHWVAMIFASATGLVHLAFGVSNLGTPLGIAFLIAGLGYVGAIMLFLRGYRRQRLYLIGIPYVGAHVVLYVVINWPNVVFLADGSVFVVGLVDKAIELLLIVALIVLYRREG